MTINRVDMDHRFLNLVNSVNDSELSNGINLASSKQSNLDIEFEKFWNSVKGFDFIAILVVFVRDLSWKSLHIIGS